MSSFIAGARSQLQLITEHRAGGTRSAFRSALSLHFAINPFHTKPHHHHHHHPPLHHPLPFLHLSSVYFSTHVYALTSLPPSFNWFFFLLAIFCKVFLLTVSPVHTLHTLLSLNSATLSAWFCFWNIAKVAFSWSVVFQSKQMIIK